MTENDESPTQGYRPVLDEITVTAKTREAMKQLLGHPKTGSSEYHEMVRQVVLLKYDALPDGIREDMIDIERELREEAGWGDVPRRFLDDDQDYRAVLEDD